MKRFVLTGAPGAGKTSVLRLLEQRGYAVVEEAAADIIAQAQAGGVDAPWLSPGFVDRIVALQRRRQLAAKGPVQLFDRSPVCTLALSRWLGFAPSAALVAELARIERENVYERPVLFLRNLGVIEPTAARRISFEDTVRFEFLPRRQNGGEGSRIVTIRRCPQ